MRSFRSLALMTALLAGLVAYLYFVDAKKPVGETEEKPKVFDGLKADAVEELKISTIAGGTAELKKGADGWALTNPTGTKADQSEVTSITSNLASLAVERVVDESPSNLGDYGLKEPVVEVSFKSKGDKDFRVLQLGTKTPTGSDMYAKVAGSKRVFLVMGYLESTFNREPFDLRDKKILNVDRDKVDQIEIAGSGGTVALRKTGGEWRISAPVAARGDFGAIEGLISRLQSAQMKAVVNEHASDLKAYGLDKPAVLVTIGLGSARAGLALGGKNDKGDIYARDVTGDMVVSVAPDLLTDLQKGATDYRVKDVFEFRPYNLSKIEITRGTEIFVVEKQKGKDGADVWVNLAAKKTLDTPKVEDALSKLSGLRAQSFADPKARTGLDQPVLVVTAAFDDGKKTEVARFGRDGADAYAGRTDEPGASKLDPKEFDAALKGLDALK
jgi:Domain of unknown function (DUF4340)